MLHRSRQLNLPTVRNSIRWSQWRNKLKIVLGEKKHGEAPGQKYTFTPELARRRRAQSNPKKYDQKTLRRTKALPRLNGTENIETVQALQLAVNMKAAKALCQTNAFFLCGWFKQLFVSKSQVLALKYALEL
jgi:hypothetical protein